MFTVAAPRGPDQLRMESVDCLKMSMSVKRQREDAGQDTGRKQFDNVNPANPEAIFETSMGTITCEIFLDKVRERYVPRTAYALFMDHPLRRCP